MENLTIFGIKISNLSKQQVLTNIENYLLGNDFKYLVTANPEIILQARKNEEYWYIINQADLVLADGFGLKLAAFSFGKNIKRITGADLLSDVLKIAQEKKAKVVVVNWAEGLSKKEEIKQAVEKKYPRLAIEVYDIFLPATTGHGDSSKHYQNLLKTDFSADIVLLNLGAPHQEKFIYHVLRKKPGLKFAVGLGGSFDFLTGKIKRAPKIFRTFGLEWLWRLLCQPKKRLKRIYRAVIVFSWKFFKFRFIYPFLYRPNVLCLLYRKEKGEYQFLIAERRDQENHWQFPQGGTEGEDLKTAGQRELQEEIGTDKFIIKAEAKNIHSYKFENSMCKFKILSKQSSGYKGQKQGLVIAEFIGTDADIKINFWEHQAWKWVSLKNLSTEVHPRRREVAEKSLKKFKELIKI